MKDSKRIEVIATTGEKRLRVLWIERRRNGFHWGSAMPKSGVHHTYHASGHMHIRGQFNIERELREKLGIEHPTKDMIDIYREIYGDVHHDISNGQPLSQFEGIRQLGNIAIVKEGLYSLPKSYAPYEDKKLDEVVYIDTRLHRRNLINIDLELVEPGRFDLLKALPKIFPEPHMHIFTSVAPWLVISTY